MPDLAAAADTEAGFLDVAANALSVIILATMMLIVVSAPVMLLGDRRPTDETPALTFPLTPRPTARPLFSYHFVTPAGLTDLDFDALAETGESAQGSLSVQTPRTALRDWNEYKAQFRPDYAAIRASAQALDVDAVEAAVERLTARFENENVAPTLFVTPDATAIAAPLYWGLRARGAQVRFRVFDYATAVPFSHNPGDFETAGGFE